MPVIKVKSEKVKIKVPVTVLRIEPTTQAKTVEPTIEKQVITPDEGIFALSSVTVNPVTSEIDENIKAENIKEGVSILGVEGNVVEANPSLVDINDYFETTITKDNSKYFFVGNIFRQLPENFKIETTDLSYLFFNYKGTHIPTLDTSNVVNMSDMFYGCENIEEIPTLNTTNVTNMSNIFRDCKKLKSIPQIDTSKVTLMSYGFYNCSLIEEIPQMDFSKLTSATYLFDSCKKVITIPELDLSSMTNINGAFNGMSSLVNFGGAKNLGKSYNKVMSANYSGYKLSLSSVTNLTEQSLINVLNGLYDIASMGVKTQTCQLGSTNLAKLTSAEGQQALATAQQKGWNIS